MSLRKPIDITQENRTLGEIAPAVTRIGGIIGILALVAALLLGFVRDGGTARFFHAYYVNLIYFMSLSLGALFFVVLHHLVRAGWSVVVRRFAEALASNAWLLGLLFIPIFFGMDHLYLWTDAEAVAHDHLLQHKQAWLNQPFFIGRCVAYFLVWMLLARYFMKKSVDQDKTGDPMLSVRMERFAGPAMVLYALTVSFASFDIVMSLDPHWYSTMFGVYIFSGSVLGFLALLPIITSLLQAKGRLVQTITVEHYHDMGKLIFAFTVFWAYIAFSQYMLIWYANIPEETTWFLRRQTGEWTRISLLLLFGHFIVPFLILLPRFVKRSKLMLGGAALWILAIHWIDLYWLTMPELSRDRVPLNILDLLCFVGIGGIYLAAAAHRLRHSAIVPEKDPRLAESLVSESV